MRFQTSVTTDVPVVSHGVSWKYDVEIDPPPDLALEVDIAGSALNRMRIYRTFGVPEVWRMAGDRLSFHRLNKGSYIEVFRSDAFPAIVPGVVEQLMRRRCELGQIPLVREFVRRLPHTARAARTSR